MYQLHLQYSQLPLNTNDFHAMVRISPESVHDKQLPPKSMLYLLDVSGSVDIKMVKESIIRSLPFLRDEDEICVISFSTETSVDIPWTKCTYVNKNKMIEDIINIKTGGWSNISNGVFHAIEQSMERDAQIVVVSDGCPNSGVLDGNKMIKMIKNTIHGTNTRIHAFGYGDHETEFLRNLSDACGGTYNYIRTAEELPVAYGSVLGAAMSTVLQGVSISLKSEEILFTDMDNKTIQSLYIGDVYAEENKDTIFKCHVIHDTNTFKIDYTVSGINIITGESITYNAHQTIERGEDNMQCEKVCNRIEELRVVEQLKKARLSDTVDRSMQILKGTKTPLKSLQEDIDLLIASYDTEFNMKSLLNRIEQEYSQQRDNRSDDLLSEYYTPFRMWTSREVSHNNN